MAWIAGVSPGASLAQAPSAPDHVGLPGVTPESLASAKEIMKMDGYGAAVTAAMAIGRNEYVSAFMKQSGFSREEAATVVDQFLLPEMKARVSELADIEAEIVASRLSAADLAEIAAFYRTPLGQKIIAQRIEMTKELTVAAGLWRRRVMADALARYRRHPAPPAASN